eukprot:CAMPEP_0170178294 /NCGR_PEP_ID=MMETSP0040_2-20121228/11791_1 /TAXON_ID=641309 /ORGANISM="Lotharella oceanica, Strain CCMP622" /LENGTH=91 /DNA_ID=CAMNT_0010421315 /DNA_START=85 /DNA_END=360 /DNA_ORIENTATION=-
MMLAILIFLVLHTLETRGSMLRSVTGDFGHEGKPKRKKKDKAKRTFELYGKYTARGERHVTSTIEDTKDKPRKVERVDPGKKKKKKKKHKK